MAGVGGIAQGAGAYPAWRRAIDYANFQFDRKLLHPRVRFETLGGVRVKRVSFRDERSAIRTEEHFARLGSSRFFPTLLGRSGAELLVEFVHGPILRRRDIDRVGDVAGFFADLYGQQASRSTTLSADMLVRLRRELGRLQAGGVLDADTVAKLADAGERLAPAEMWSGFDYSDPVPKNFVSRVEAPLCAIDVEALRFDRPIGLGVAKACALWLKPVGDTLLAQIVEKGGPDLREYFGFLELYYFAQSSRRNLDKKWWRRLDATALARFAA